MRKTGIIPVFVALACGALSAALFSTGSRSDVAANPIFSPGYLDYVSARGLFRPFEARISGPWKHAPFDPAAKPGLIRLEDLGDPKTRRIVALEDRIRREADSQSSPAAVSALSTLLLIQGRTDEAISGLEAAAARRDADSFLRDELAAAFLVRGDLQGRPRDYVKGLSLLSGESRNGAPRGAAGFNRALLLERLYLTSAAREAWDRYRLTEKESAWKAEAESRPPGGEPLAHAAESLPFADKDPQRIREIAWDQQLVDWATAFLDGREGDPGRALDRVRRSGRQLAHRSEDELLNDTIAAIDGLADRPALKKTLALGIQALARGRRRFLDSSFSEARSHLEEAVRSLELANCPAWLWARIWLAGIDLYSGDFVAALKRLDRVDRSSEARPYPAVKGRSQWARGLIRVRQGRLAEALAHYDQARQRFQQTGEVGNLAAVKSLIAENLRLLGRPDEAWRHWHRAVATFHRFPASVAQHNAMIEAADAALGENEIETALIFQKEGLDVARRSGQSDLLAEALNRVARLETRRGRLREAQALLATARRAAGSIADSDFRETLLQDIAISEADAELAGNAEAAREKLVQAEAYYRRIGLGLDVPRVLLKKARLEIGLGRPETAEQDLDRAIDELEQRAAALGNPAARIDHFRTIHQVYDELIALQVDRNEPLRALAASERKRWALFRLGAGGSPEPTRWTGPELEASLDRLPPSETLVEYSVLEDRLLIWVVRRSGIEFRQQRIDRQTLLSSVEILLEALGRDNVGEPVGAILRSLHTALIRPIGPIDPDQTLVFLPDKFLRAVPFSALLDDDGHYLIEKHQTAAAPSVLAYLASPAFQRERRQRPERILVVGDPTFDRSAFPWLPSLEGAKAEAERIATMYRHPILLLERAATRDAFFEALDGSEILHFAGHAVAVPGNPAASCLLVAPDAGGGPAAVYGSELHGRRLNRLKLVILSACATSDSGLEEGVFGLAQPFMAAGAAAVIGTLWRVRDESASQIMTDLHRHLASLHKPISALRAAQLESLRRGEDVSRWAAFQTIVGRQFRYPKEE